jgi:hypothetical protein
MTPTNNQQGERKDLLPTDDGSPRDRAASTPRADANRSARVLDTQTATQSASDSNATTGDDDDGDDAGAAHTDGLDDGETVLMAVDWNGTGVYHAIDPADDDDDETDRTLCNKVGSYRRVPARQAREEADRYCRACAAKQDGTECRPCPTCGRLIGVTYWPQHVGQCTGTPNHPNRSPTTDSNSGSDTDATTGERRT